METAGIPIFGGYFPAWRVAIHEAHEEWRREQREIESRLRDHALRTEREEANREQMRRTRFEGSLIQRNQSQTEHEEGIQ